MNGKDDVLLGELVDNELPGQALFELETYVNGLYRKVQLLISTLRRTYQTSQDESRRQVEDVEKKGEMTTASNDEDQKKRPLEGEISDILEKARQRIDRVGPFINKIREQLGSDAQEFDIQLLRYMRRSSCLSPVLGAGVSAADGCRAPSWSGLVQELVQRTLDRGFEVPVQVSEEVVPEAPSDNPEILLGSTLIRSRTVEFEQKTVKEYAEGERQRAQEILGAIRSGVCDNKTLMEGADLVYRLCGQHLFTLMTSILYRNDRQPSVIHRAIARLAHAQHVSDRPSPEPIPGWDAIITYNFDSFMSEALKKEGVPSAAWAMKGDRMMGDPDRLAEELGQLPWIQPVYHLHGYTPKKPFLITHVRFVFAASQYRDTYHQPSSEIFRKVVEEYLENPVHVALYIGCSFTDLYMNQLLREAIERYPWRYHYALLPLPRKGDDGSVDESKRIDEGERFLEMGVRVIWFGAFSEIPHLIARLE